MPQQQPKNIVTDNRLIARRTSMTPLMTRCYVKTIWEFEKKLMVWEDLHPKDIFGDPDYGMLLKYTIPIGEIDPDYHSSDVKKAMKKLTTTTMEIGSVDDDKDWWCFPMLAGCKYSDKAKVFTVSLSPILVPMLIEQKKNFTKFDALTAMQFTGKYTERFYEICHQYRSRKSKQFFLDVDEIRKMFRLENKYPRFPDIVKYVILPAQQEMREAYDNGTCDLAFTHYTKDEDKVGSSRGRKTYDRLWFVVMERDSVIRQPKVTPVTALNHMETKEKLDIIFNVLSNIFGADNPYYKGIALPLTSLITHDTHNADRMISVLSRIRKEQSDGKISDVAAYTRRVFEKEFKLTPNVVSSQN